MSTTLQHGPLLALDPEPRSAAEGLPVQLTSFVGRQKELAEVRDLLRGRTRLLTLTGPGGTGKTRLALEVAGALADDFPGGVRWVELAPLSTARGLAEAVAEGLGVREEPGRPAERALLELFCQRSLLLVLDNCEHVVDACAGLVDSLLRGCPRLVVLATSREALGVAGETAWLVPPLSLPAPRRLPTPQELLGFEAVQLFVERARAVLPAFALTRENAPAVAQVCRRLDGIPLAIELAAARARVLTPEQIAARLADRFRLLTTAGRGVLPRQQTLRATIDWSYELLSDRERLLLQRVSVFEGGFSLGAAEAVCPDPEIEEWEILDLISSLVDKSLLEMRERGGEARYRMLDSIDQYGEERLAERGGERAFRDAHARFYLQLAEEALPHLHGGSPDEWLDRLAAEHDNFRAALDWAERAGEAETLLRLAGALGWFWMYRVHWSEGLGWLDAALGAASGAATRPALARALHAAGMLSWMLGDAGPARARLVESEALWRALGEERQRALTLLNLAQVLVDSGEPDAALEAAEESVRLARAVGRPWDLGIALTGALAFVHHRCGRLAEAEALYAESEAVWRSMDDPWGLALATSGRSMAAWMRRDLPAAAQHAATGLRALKRLHDPWFAARGLFVPAALAVLRGDLPRAARLLGAADALRETVGAQLLPFERPGHRWISNALRDGLGADAFGAAATEGREMPLRRALDFALEGLTETAPPAPAPPREQAPGPAAVEASAEAPPDLRVLALGPLEVYLAGERLAPAAWPYAKPRELLLYLLCHPAGRTKEQIGLALWPEASAAQVRNSFHVTLHHLRKTLGRADWIVYEEERYRFAEGVRTELDADRFERRMAEVLRAPEPDAAALEEALAAYRGPLLQEEVLGDWPLERHDRVQRLWVEGMIALGDARHREGAHAEAATLFQRVLVGEDLREDVHRRLMVALAARGDRAGALRHYARLVDLLREELDTEPEEATVEVYEALRRGEVRAAAPAPPR